MTTHLSKVLISAAQSSTAQTNFIIEMVFCQYTSSSFAYLWSRKEYLPSGLDVCHYAGNSRVAVASCRFSSSFYSKLFLVAGNMGLEVALVGLRLVKRGQSCVVSQPQTVATFVDMQRDATVHRMPVMMIVHEMRECALFHITVHCNNKNRRI